jgi:alcohol dehydrogenase class IV
VSEGDPTLLEFVCTTLPSRVIFGHGTSARLPEEVERLGLQRALVLATPSRKPDAERLSTALGARSAGVLATAVMHTPVNVTEAALAVVEKLGADGLVAVGGGSTTGLSKSIALRTDLPQIIIPTTYAGSEMTPTVGETKDGVKTTQRSPRILPEVVIYDVERTLSLPVSLSATSGMNAIAHAVEALYARDRNPVVMLMAEEGVRAFAQALPRIAADPVDREARAEALYGAWLCGVCLGSASMAIHHKLCHVIGGLFNLPHAQTHTVILPHATAFNAAAAPDAMVRLARALNAPDAALGLYELSGRLGCPRALRDLGMPESGIDQAVTLSLRNAPWNPLPIEAEAVRELIRRAWRGDAPASVFQG